MSDGIRTILKLDYSHAEVALEVNYRESTTAAGHPRSTTHLNSAIPKVALLHSIQALYDRVCEALELHPHQLKIDEFTTREIGGGQYGAIRFSGVRSAVEVVEDFLTVAPDYVCGMSHTTVANDQNPINKDALLGAGRSHHARNLELLDPIVRDLTKISNSVKKPSKAAIQRRDYIRACICQALGPNVSLCTVMEVTDKGKKRKKGRKGRKAKK